MRFKLTILALAVACVPAAAQWELGALGGYGFRPDLSVEGPEGSANVGFGSGPIWGFYGGLTEYGYLGGEARYLYESSTAKLKWSGPDETFSTRAHLVHFDFVVHTAKSGARLRPFLVIGGGVKVYEGTGPDRAYQPGSEWIGFTRTREVKGLMTPGAGIKFQISKHMSIRAEFRDYISPRPEEIFAPGPGVTIKGWVHDFAPLFGIGGTW